MVLRNRRLSAARLRGFGNTDHALGRLPTRAIPISLAHTSVGLSVNAAAFTWRICVVGSKAFYCCIIDGASLAAIAVLFAVAALLLKPGLLLRLSLVLHRAGARAVLLPDLILRLRLQGVLDWAGARAVLLLDPTLRLLL